MGGRKIKDVKEESKLRLRRQGCRR